MCLRQRVLRKNHELRARWFYRESSRNHPEFSYQYRRLSALTGISDTINARNAAVTSNKRMGAEQQTKTTDNDACRGCQLEIIEEDILRLFERLAL